MLLHVQSQSIPDWNRLSPIMKTTPVAPGAIALVALIGLLASAPIRAETPATGPHVLVTFDHPENFVDVRDRYQPTVQGRDEIFASLRAFIIKRAAPRLPEGDAFYITFTNIKLAGVFPLVGFAEHRIV
jgi:hypothetical protein